MAETTVRIDGWPVAVGTALAFATLKKAFDTAFPGITLHVYSGYRSYDDQAKIFLDRYVPQTVGTGPYGDVRWWNGIRYVRTSGEGTVAQPGTSNHGNGRALDIRDSGSGAGVTTAGNARSNWIRANAARYGFDPAGYGFGEPWHIELAAHLDPWAGGSDNIPASSDADTIPEEDDMGTIDNEHQVKQLKQAADSAKQAVETANTVKNAVGRIETEELPKIRKIAEAALDAANKTKVAAGHASKANKRIEAKLDKLLTAEGVDVASLNALFDSGE
ncbi:M15 family metallopeptidase [Microbacterium gilvum]|uniref:D-alanyl-D-alanine carboxypeptidase-like core domain-containing protein n=1 Tax=Microbacterium gilvum TaxID=1336204 RepID=A0ABP9A5S9_9MICO